MSEGRRYPGMEHWLPLFHDKMETLFDYLPGTALAIEPSGRGRRARAPHHDRRLLRGAARGAEGYGGSPPYKPLPPDRLYLADE